MTAELGDIALAGGWLTTALFVGKHAAAALAHRGRRDAAVAETAREQEQQETAFQRAILAHVQSANTQIAKLQDDLSAEREQRESLVNTLHEQERQIWAQTRELSALRQERDALVARVENLESVARERDVLVARCEELETRLHAAQRSFEMSEARARAAVLEQMRAVDEIEVGKKTMPKPPPGVMAQPFESRIGLKK